MVATFEVPGSVRLRDVSRPAPAETPAGRMHRLAAKARIEGCQVFAVAGHDRMFAVTSGTVAGTAYAVDALIGSCTCPAGKNCKHVAAVLAELGELAGLGDEGAVVVRTAAARTCGDCHGDGYRKAWTGDRPGDWWAAPCRRCGSTGTVASA